PQVRAMAADSRTRRLAVAVAASPSVLLYQLDNLAAAPTVVPLPSAPSDARLAGDGGPLLVTAGTQLVRITLPDGAVSATAVDGSPASAAQDGGRTLVALRDRHQVAVLDGGSVRRTISGNLFSADRVLTTGGHAVVLDWLRNALFELDVAGGTIKQGLRA